MNRFLKILQRIILCSVMLNVGAFALLEAAAGAAEGKESTSNKNEKFLNLRALPSNCIISVASFLPTKDMVNLRLVNKKMARLITPKIIPQAAAFWEKFKTLNRTTQIRSYLKAIAKGNDHEASLMIRAPGFMDNVLKLNDPSSAGWVLIRAAESGHLEMVSKLIENQDFIAKVPNDDAGMALAWSASNGYEHVVSKLIENQDFIAKVPNDDAGKALAWSASNGYEHVVSDLIKNKDFMAKVLEEDAGWGLIQSAAHGHQQIVTNLTSNQEFMAKVGCNVAAFRLADVSDHESEEVLKEVLRVLSNSPPFMRNLSLGRRINVYVNPISWSPTKKALIGLCMAGLGYLISRKLTSSPRGRLAATVGIGAALFGGLSWVLKKVAAF